MSSAAVAKLKESSQERKICGGCHRPDAELRCSRCKEEWYCNETCQKVRWPKHKNFCEINVTKQQYPDEKSIVAQAYEIQSRPRGSPNFKFAGVGRRCKIGDLGPVPTTTTSTSQSGGSGRPIAIWKSLICYSMGIPLLVVHDRTTGGEGNQFFTFLMADPISGLALPEFQTGLGDCEIVRADGKDISDVDALFLWSAFDSVMDYFGNGRGAPKNYKKFFLQEQEKFNEGKSEVEKTTFMNPLE